MAEVESRSKATPLTGGYRSRGDIDLPPAVRVIDHMGEAGNFIAVAKAEVYVFQVGGC